tara:strand:- start:22904 stop:23101 length:198 start_codon:yes stop_codon:yes gene_type:complete
MKDSSHCAECGQSLPQDSRLEVDWSALSKAINKLKEEIGWGIPDETYKRNLRKLANNNKIKEDRK